MNFLWLTFFILLSCSTTGLSDRFVSPYQSNELDPFTIASSSSNQASYDLDKLSYTNTQKRWARRYEGAWLKETRYLSKNWRESIKVSQFPANSSVRTRAELDYLIKFHNSLSQKLKQQILRERSLFSNGEFGQININTIFFAEENPIQDLFIAIFQDLKIAVFHFKNKYNRVRPHYLESKIKPFIFTPLHPSYPSGHSTYAHVLAHLLSKLNPKNSELFFKDAKRIGKNRELAGVHYPSDTAAGKQLANDFFNNITANPEIKVLLGKAQIYWEENNLSHNFIIAPKYK